MLPGWYVVFPTATGSLRALAAGPTSGGRRSGASASRGGGAPRGVRVGLRDEAHERWRRSAFVREGRVMRVNKRTAPPTPICLGPPPWVPRSLSGIARVVPKQLPGVLPSPGHLRVDTRVLGITAHRHMPSFWIEITETQRTSGCPRGGSWGAEALEDFESMIRGYSQTRRPAVRGAPLFAQYVRACRPNVRGRGGGVSVTPADAPEWRRPRGPGPEFCLL